MSLVRFHIVFIPLIILNTSLVFAQPADYYNDTEGLKGDHLKEVLHNIIKRHVDFSYSYSRDIMEYTDQDPENQNNVILIYLQESRNANLYGIGGDYINREHLWAKSHGDFSGIRPMDSDVHNLHPADASVNEDRGNKDFDNIHSLGIGTRHAEATACYYTDSTWEPGPLTKGQVARALFYMATRYEGDPGETDLELVAYNNTYPDPLHGNLNALLEWNRQYPPTDFERRRNERLYRIQQNRNPFVDHPEFADFIWAGKSPSGPEFRKLYISPQIPESDDAITFGVRIDSEFSLNNVTLYWGTTYKSTENQSPMTASGSDYSATIEPSGYSSGDMIYFTVATTLNDSNYTYSTSYLYPAKVEAASITPIPEAQGTGTASPLKGNTITIAGRITANFDNSFYMQTSDPERSGINVYNSLLRGQVGDSVIVSGTVDEYQNLTEITKVSYNYNYKDNQTVEPRIITTQDMSEMYEGMLVTIKNATFTQGGTIIPDAGGNFTFTDNNGQGTLYISTSSRLINQALPSGKINITGILGQYNSTYQLLPRDIGDFALYTSTIDIENHLGKIYPNPTQNQLYITSDKEIKEVRIFNLSGQQIFNRYSSETTINTSFLNPGIYFIVIRYRNDSVQKEKFIKLGNN